MYLINSKNQEPKQSRADYAVMTLIVGLAFKNGKQAEILKSYGGRMNIR